MLAIFIIIYGIIIHATSGSTKQTGASSSEMRQFGALPITLTLIASQLGGGMLLGTAQEAYVKGFEGIFYALSIIIGFLLLGCGIAGRIQTLQAATTAQLFETVYDAPSLKRVASILSILTLSGLFMTQIVGSRSLLCSLEITSPLFFTLFWLLIILAATFGNLKGLIWANFIQIGYIFVLFTGICIWCLSKESFDFFCLPCLEDLQASFSSLNAKGSSLICMLLMPALYCLIEQDIAQRFFAARTKKTAATAALCASALFFLFSLIPVYLGIKARVLNLTLAPNASPLLPAILFLTNAIVASLAACGVLIAIASTANSLLCAVSANITQDFSLANNRQQKLPNAQLISLLLGLSCLCISFYMPLSLIEIIIKSYAVSVVCLFVPLLFAYYNKKLPRQAAFYAVFAGGIGYLVSFALPFTVPHECFALACSFVGFLSGRAIGSINRSINF
jgi:SSS family solute:Na+ symporter